MDTQSSINHTVVLVYINLLVFGVGGTAYVVWCFLRSRALLSHWAEKNGFQILDSTFMPFSKDIVDYLFGGLKSVYHLRIRDREGREHSGWLECGDLWIFKKAEARWKAES